MNTRDLPDIDEDDVKFTTDEMVKMVARYQKISMKAARVIVDSWMRPRTDEERTRVRMRQDCIRRDERYRKRADWLRANMPEFLASEGVGVAWHANPIKWRADDE